MEIPSRHERPEDPPKNAHEATEARQKIKRCVSRPMIINSVQVHFDRDLAPTAVFFLERKYRLFCKSEQVLLLLQGVLVQVNRFVVLESQMRLLELEGSNLADLAAYRDVGDA